MDYPNPAPYLGSWEYLVNALLHNPFLGSGRKNPNRNSMDFAVPADRVELNPQPLPPQPDPFRQAAVAYVAELVNIQELAHAVSNKQLQQELISGADAAMERFFDDWCGTPWHGPFPHPRPSQAWELAIELVSVANAGTGAFREGIMRAAGLLADKAFTAANRNSQEFVR